MTKQVQQAITPTHVLGSTGTADTSDLGYRTLANFKGDLGLGTSLTQTINNGNGTATNPAFTFANDPNTGIIRAAADELGFVTNGSEKVRIDNNGNVGIGTTVVIAKFQVATNANKSVFFKDASHSTLTNLTSAITFTRVDGSGDVAAIFGWNNGGLAVAGREGLVFATGGGVNYSFTTEHMRITSAGNVGIGTGTPATKLHVNGTIRYTNRPAAGTITAIGFDANGDLKEASSSLRYKHDIQDYSKGLAEVMQLRPVSFKFNGEDITNIGFIAEEVDALGMTEVMLYDEEQRPNAIIYANMVSLLTKAIQEQQSIIDELKARIETLESNV